MRKIMGQYLVVSRVENLEEHLALAREYGVGFEINDFFDPEVLESKERQQEIIEAYQKAGLPEGSTMHGAFLDGTGFVFQNYNLFLNKTALENITEGLIVGRGIKKGLAQAKAHELLARFSLTHRENAYPSELSGGQQQRVTIARALAGDPDIIYFDEPTSALDPELTRDVLSILKELAQQGLTMVVVTHELTFAKSVANKVVFMEAGHVMEAGDAQTIFGNPKELRTKEFLETLV